MLRDGTFLRICGVGISRNLMKILLTAVLVVLSGLLVQGQAFPEVKTFEAPPYPPVALAVRAEGDVQVVVEVDDTGKVISANAVAGHRLLQTTSQAVALKWTFTPRPGRHFITLRFLFRLARSGNKKSTKLNGHYTLRFIEPRVRIIQTVSYQSSGCE